MAFVLPSEIAALHALEAYLKLPHNMPAAKVKMTDNKVKQEVDRL